MSAQPGWYDAGVSGQQRWWDGAQWTDHERAVAAASQPTSMVHATPMGWYPVNGTSDVRWWDGISWTPYRLRAGSPRPDAFAIEPGATGIVLGTVFIVLSISQFSLYRLLDEPMFTFVPLLLLVAGVLWLIGGVRVGAVRKLPMPTMGQVFDAASGPIPGKVEGAGAGWYPVAGQVSRWWTGARWSPYVAQKFGIRPTHHGPRAYRTSMIIGWVIVGVGVLAAFFGAAFAAAVGRWAGTAFILPAVVFTAAGGAVLLTSYLRRYAVILPSYSPTSR